MILRASRNRFLTLTRQIGAGGALLSALTFPLAGCDDGSETKPPLIQEDSIGLAAFPGCDPLLDYLQDEAITLIDTFGGVGVQYDDVTALGGEPARADNEGGAGGEQSPADPSFSGTNVQEAGVDEPDRVKTDGRFLYLVRDGWFLIYDAADLTLVSQTAVIDGWEGTLLVEGDTALVLGHTWGAPEEAFADADADRLARGTKAVISVYDLNDRAAPRLVRRSYLEGEILSARLVAGTARVVVRAELARGIDVDAVAGEIRGGGGS
ncbi:MAG: beta-propeller domain-containing protein, partial [Myxococcales bacterium]|nr:beta-propeller domain-containing protein [Myxococcales bacterium]